MEAGPPPRPTGKPLAQGAVLAALAALVLASSTRTYDPNEPKLIAAFLLLGIAWAALAFELPRSGAPLPVPVPLDGWVLAAASTAVLLAAHAPRGGAGADSAWAGVAAALAYGAGRLAFRREPGPIDAAVTILAAASGAVALVQTLRPGLLGYVFRTPQGQASSELTGTFANPDYFACWLLMALPFASSLGRRERWGRAGRAAGLAIVAMIVLTASRAAFLALAVQWALSRTAGARLPGPRLAVPAVLLIALAAWSAIPDFLDQLQGTQTMRQRILIWRATLQMAADRPLLGHGPGAFGAAFPSYRDPEYRVELLPQVVEYAHDLPLHVLAAGGLAGGWMLLAGLAAAWASVGPGPARAALAGVLTQNLFSVSIFVPSLTAALALLVGAGTGSRAPGGTAVGSRGRRRRRTPAAAVAAWKIGGMIALSILSLAGAVRGVGSLEAGRLLKKAAEETEAGPRGGPPGWRDRAASDLESALALRPWWPPLHYRLAGVDALSGELARGAARYALTEGLSPRYAEAPANRAEVALAMDRRETALALARRWKDMNRADPASHVLLARAAEVSGEVALALQSALQARRLGTGGPALEDMIRRLSGP